MGEKERKYMGKTRANQLEIVAVNKKERCKIEIA
jgi:hypothetical protein